VLRTASYPASLAGESPCYSAEEEEGR